MISAGSHEGSGALHFGGEPLGGVVLFDLGRVCWAALPGSGRRLTDLVCATAGVSRVLVGDIYAECRRNGKPVGEALVERNLVSASQLRGLLLEQTAETLVALSERLEEPVWISHRGGGYQPRFTFTVPEVIASAAAKGLAYDPSEARDELARLVDGFGIGAAFDLDGEPLPLAIGNGTDDYGQLRELGTWVSSVIAGWPAASLPKFVVADIGGAGVVAWRAAGLAFGARYLGRTELARAVAQLMRRT